MYSEKSKSQIKRELKSIQDLGGDLAQLPASKLKKIPLPEELREAIAELKKINSFTARKRHLQFIGKLMRRLDNLEEIQKAYDELLKGDKLSNQHFQLIEKWRTRLMSDDQNALTEFIQKYPNEHIQQLGQLIRQAKAERVSEKNLGAAKALFRLLVAIVS